MSQVIDVPSKTQLKLAGWDNFNKIYINSLVNRDYFKNTIAVFDFDNTCIAHDVSEAMIEYLIISKNEKFYKALENNQKVLPENLMSHYEDRCANGDIIETYKWLVQIFKDLTPSDLIEATENMLSSKDNLLEHYKKPYLYPEMVELMKVLDKAGVEIFIVSASNPWSVRYVVEKWFNPKLESKISMQNIYGLETTLIDPYGNEHKDRDLVIQDILYADMKREKLENYRLTDSIVEPASTFSGKKVICTKIAKDTGKEISLVAGDSENDKAMLSLAKIPLLIQRPGKEKLAEEIDEHALIQPVKKVRGKLIFTSNATLL